MYDFDKIHVYSDNIDEMDIIRNTINIEKREDAFYIADIGGVVNRHLEWISKMPKVTPHYGNVSFTDTPIMEIYINYYFTTE